MIGYDYDFKNLCNIDELEKMEQKYSVLVFFDILGFKNIVVNDIKKASIISNILSNICEIFNNTIQQFITYYDYDFLNDGENEYGILDGMVIPKMQSTTFSDSIILSCPLLQKNQLLIIKNMIRALSEIQLTLIRQGFLIRGGITIGNVCHTNKYVFGEAVIEAYLLESTIANYPRIIVSDKLSKLIIKLLEEQKFDDLEEDFADLLDEESFKTNYLRIDDDQKLYIDFFGTEIVNKAIELCPQHKNEFEDDYLNPIKDLIDEGIDNETISIKVKYQWLENKYNNLLIYLKQHYNLQL